MDSSHNESIDKIYKSNGNSFQEQNSKCGHLRIPLTSLVAQTVKSLSTMRATWVRSLGRQDPLEKEMAIHFSTIAWNITWREEPGRLQSMRSQKSRTRLSNFTSLHFKNKVFFLIRNLICTDMLVHQSGTRV